MSSLHPSLDIRVPHRGVRWSAGSVVVCRRAGDDGDARLHTDESVVFDVADGLISRVAVYLQTSERRRSDKA